MLTIVVKRIKEQSETFPVVLVTKHGAFDHAVFRVPDRQTISANSAAPAYAKHDLGFPVLERLFLFWPDVSYGDGETDQN